MSRGWSATATAAELGISELTVKSPVGRIFGELALRDRAAAIGYAYDHGAATPRSGP